MHATYGNTHVRQGGELRAHGEESGGGKETAGNRATASNLENHRWCTHQPFQCNTSMDVIGSGSRVGLNGEAQEGRQH